MKGYILIFFLFLLSGFSSLQVDLISELSNHFHQSKAKEIAKHFSPTVSLAILNDNNTYSRVQAEIILESFFKMNQPKGAKIIHRLDNNANFQHAVILLNTVEGNFRVSYSIRNNNDQAQLVEIRIEKSGD